ncbi:hypothetical protein GC209_13195 [bacterium]|nr:hypothetical protein [bacterium]
MRIFKFRVHNFLRPTKGELFGLRHKDIKVGIKPPHLKIAVTGGNTGKRTSVTMPICVPLYKGMLNPFDEAGPEKNTFVWMPEYTNLACTKQLGWGQPATEVLALPKTLVQ